MNHTGVGRTISIRVVTLVTALFLLGTAGCSGTLDTRCQVDGGYHTSKITKSVVKSRLWDLYFDKMAGSSALVELSVNVDRRTKRGSHGGDYDPGTVTFFFEAKSLKHGSTLLKQKGEFEIDMFLIGMFDKDTTREEMQEIAFRDAEKEAYPFLDRWIQLAAIRAIGREGTEGSRFVPALEKMLADQWTSGDMRAATEVALAKIQG